MNKENPSILYIAKFKDHEDSHYNAKEEQAYVADRRTPLEAPYRIKKDYGKYFSEEKYNQDLDNALKAQREEILDDFEGLNCLGELAKVLRQYGRG